MKILVLNCGSSSLKYQVLKMSASENTLLAKGLPLLVTGAETAGQRPCRAHRQYECLPYP